MVPMDVTSLTDETEFMSEFTVEKAKAALQEILSAYTLPENVIRLDEARDNAGNDMLKYMQFVFPVATQIQMEVLPNYGFQADGEGIIQFTHAVRSLERDNPEIAQMNAELQLLFIPSMVPPSSQESNYDG